MHVAVLHRLWVLRSDSPIIWVCAWFLLKFQGTIQHVHVTQSLNQVFCNGYHYRMLEAEIVSPHRVAKIPINYAPNPISEKPTLLNENPSPWSTI